MFTHIDFRSKQLRRLQLKIKPDIPFNEVLETLEEIDFICDPKFQEHLRFSLLELLNNSLRAHREHDIQDSIVLEFIINGEDLHVKVQDAGKGFDPGKLPYDLHIPAETIDIHSQDFENYRSDSGHTRFGMGLFIAKRTFDDFHLSFVDNDHEIVDWGSTKLIGTRIVLKKKGETLRVQEKGA
jgi:anti-sigma regulatory factor (Ser/Thr protein kinase)